MLGTPKKKKLRCWMVGDLPGEAETQQEWQLYEWKLHKALNLKEESSEHLRWTHLEQVQHCIDLSLQVTIPAHTDQGKTGPGLE